MKKVIYRVTSTGKRCFAYSNHPSPLYWSSAIPIYSRTNSKFIENIPIASFYYSIKNFKQYFKTTIYKGFSPVINDKI